MTKSGRSWRIRLRRAWLLPAAMVFAGCRTPSAPPRTTSSESVSVWEPAPAEGAADSIDSIARGYVRAAQALGERDPDSLDFSIVAESLRTTMHDRYPAYGEIAREASTLEQRLKSLKPAGEAGTQARVQALALQLAAIQTRIRMLRGETLDFDSEARALFSASPLPDTEAARRSQVRREVLALLPPSTAVVDSGTERDAARYGDYDRRFLIPQARLEAVMTAALAACRERTRSWIKLPDGEGVDLQFVRNEPWSAFSRYRGHGRSTISVNTDLPVAVDDAFELACHEGYPGHHVFNTLRDQAMQGRPEAQVQLTFSPESYVSEAAAAYAPRVAFTPAERVRIERDVLFPLAGLPQKEADRYIRISTLVRELASAEPAIAREYLDGRVEFIRAGQQLARETLMAHPNATLLYLNEYRSYMLAYTDGPRRIAASLPGGTSPEQVKARWEAYRRLMTQLRIQLP